VRAKKFNHFRSFRPFRAFPRVLLQLQFPAGWERVLTTALVNRASTGATTRSYHTFPE
jgi:hypothetical protein